MSNEYFVFKKIIETIDPGCPSLKNYEDFSPVRSAEDVCKHFKNKEQFIEKALNQLDSESAEVNRQEVIDLLKEDWAARHVESEA